MKIIDNYQCTKAGYPCRIRKYDNGHVDVYVDAVNASQMPMNIALSVFEALIPDLGIAESPMSITVEATQNGKASMTEYTAFQGYITRAGTRTKQWFGVGGLILSDEDFQAMLAKHKKMRERRELESIERKKQLDVWRAALRGRLENLTHAELVDVIMKFALECEYVKDTKSFEEKLPGGVLQ